MAEKSSRSDPAHAGSGNTLEMSIGQEVRTFRKNLGMTVAEVAKLASLSSGMLSKIERGQTSPSLATLQNLARALNVPVTTLFRRFEEERDVSYVPEGQGIEIERRGTRAGHQYRLLGHTVGGDVSVEPYMITIKKKSDVFPIFQHDGSEYLYMLDGEMDYRHGGKLYRMKPGDSLLFDASAAHGPENFRKMPVRFLSVITHSATKGSR
ncbi:MAG: XRE family transcriptional regulator [Alphaproteobacteria bacterium]|nr:XRE family transcriptional regulator [Alphaproteobacteria bacterium]MCZ6588264.1 XRE family transcriptional regulator [Alphaproteobacteria bacterium]MCZ6593085.1 XRE family transcriptional regulator [Alphaproteobacteria bacterium]MCZ6838573.1 XRE family transcriptional regulator [Alphaproteobacteria bacterium]MCZ6846622.1 XRE family transcriptional regulator [Alphaproteobacteria bacterium]